MKVSVVIPTYNAAAFIEQTVKSVISQTHRDTEIIVVNDGSTDLTVDRVNAIDDERIRIVTKLNGGFAAARNSGMAVADADAIAFLDADDLWTPRKLEMQIAALASPGTVVVGNYMREISADGSRTGRVIGEAPAPAHESLLRAEGMPCPISSMLFDMATARAAGGFDPELPQVEDLDFLAQVMRHGQLVVLPEILGYYRLHSSSMSADGFVRQRVIHRFVRSRACARLAGSDGPTLSEFERADSDNLANRRNDHLHANLRGATVAALNNDWRRAASFSFAALRLSPAKTTAALLRRALPWGQLARRRLASNAR